MNKFVITEIHQFLKVGEEAVKFYEDLYFVEDSPGAAYRKFQAHLKQQYGEDRHVSVSANRQLNPGPDMYEKTEELINQYNAKQISATEAIKQAWENFYGYSFYEVCKYISHFGQTLLCLL